MLGIEKNASETYLSNAGVQSNNQYFEGCWHFERIVDKVTVHKCCAEGNHEYQKKSWN